MIRKYMNIVIIVGCVAVVMLGLFIGYAVFKPEEAVAKAEVPSRIALQNTSLQPVSLSDTTAKIKSSTKMVYEYFFEEDNRVETSEENTPPYYLLDMTEDGLKEMFIDWEVVDFKQDKVIMRKNMPGKSNQHYILGVQDGFVAIFYKESIDGTNLKEITDKPISSLSLEEQANLVKGIEITGDEQLHKILEDYMS